MEDKRLMIRGESFAVAFDISKDRRIQDLIGYLEDVQSAGMTDVAFEFSDDDIVPCLVTYRMRPETDQEYVFRKLQEHQADKIQFDAAKKEYIALRDKFRKMDLLDENGNFKL